MRKWKQERKKEERTEIERSKGRVRRMERKGGRESKHKRVTLKQRVLRIVCNRMMMNSSHSICLTVMMELRSLTRAPRS